MAWYNFSKPKQQQILVEPEPTNNYQAFSTPLGHIGTGDLTKPFVQSTIHGSDAMVRYGNDNLFPQILNQLAVTSGLHGSILRFKANAIIGGGYELESFDISAAGKINERVFLKKNKFNKIMREITDDLLIHGRIHVLIKKDGRICRLAPEKIRVSEDRSKLYYSYNWARNIQQATYNEYYEGCQEDSVYSYYICSPGGDIYPYPTYQGCLNWVYLAAEIPSLQKDNIQNSIYPSYIITTTGKLKSDAEIQAFSDTIRLLTQPSKRGKALVFNPATLEQAPKVDALPVNNIPKAFEGLMKDISENIAVAHQLNPAIMGVKIQGQLGATTEIEDSYRIFEKNFVLPTRMELEEVANNLLEICGIDSVLIINNLQIIDDKIKQIL